MVHLHKSGVGGILGDEMGLGKTLQVIAFFAYLKEQGVSGPHCVVAPLSVMGGWELQLQRWCPSLRVLKFHGPAAEVRFSSSCFFLIDVYFLPPTQRRVVAFILILWCRVARANCCRSCSKRLFRCHDHYVRDGSVRCRFLLQHVHVEIYRGGRGATHQE